MEARNRNLSEWLSRIQSGQLRLPRFQRFEAWGYSEVKDLLETVIAGMPAGAVLTLSVGDRSPFAPREIATAEPGTERINELLLDGQQRLTALWRAFNDTYEDRTYYVHLTDTNEAGGPEVKAIRRSLRPDGRRMPLWADEAEKLLERELVPVRLLRPGAAGEQELRGWLHEATGGDAHRQLELQTAIGRWRENVSHFNLPFLSLPATTDRAAVLDVFVKMNTSSVQLTAFDIIVANVEAEFGQSMHELLDSLRGQVPGLARYGRLQDTVLRTAALWQDRAPDKPGFMNVEWRAILDDWDTILQGAQLTVEFLESESIFDASRFPIITPLAGLIVLWAETPSLTPDQIGQARRNLRRFMWRAFFTEIYESSAHTQVIRDVRALKRLINGDDTAAAEVLNAPLPTAEDLLEAGWPRKRDRLARAILATSFRGGAHDLADSSPIRFDNLEQREYHHLFPKKFLDDQGLSAQSDRALNCALITWRTNRTISSSDPIDYILERSEATTLGLDDVEARLRTHAIPLEPLVDGNYAAFLEARAGWIMEGMNRLCDGTPWSP